MRCVLCAATRAHVVLHDQRKNRPQPQSSHAFSDFRKRFFLLKIAKQQLLLQKLQGLDCCTTRDAYGATVQGANCCTTRDPYDATVQGMDCCTTRDPYGATVQRVDCGTTRDPYGATVQGVDCCLHKGFTTILRLKRPSRPNIVPDLPPPKAAACPRHRPS